MTEVYREQTVDGLFALYIEARETGAKELSEDIWERLVAINRRETVDKLYNLRNELNGLMDNKKNEMNNGLKLVDG